MKRLICLAVTAVLGAAFASAALAQSPWEELERAENALREDSRQGVGVLSPRAFKNAAEILEKAKKEFSKNGNLAELQKRLRAFTDARNAANYNAGTAKKTISGLLKARTDAIRASAPEAAPKLFMDGEKAFSEVIERIEEGKVADARKRAPEAEMKFRDAELEAIKINTINVAKKALEEAERAKAKEYAPLSYGRADSLILATDRLLSIDRYAGEKAARMAQEAVYHARLAVYITHLARMAQDEKAAREQQFLETVAQLSPLARELGVEATYEQGYARTSREMLLAIKNLKEESRTLSQEVAERNRRIEALQQELDGVTHQLAAVKEQLTAREAGLLAEIERTQQQLEEERRALAAKRAFEQKITNVETMFTPQEATVVQERGNLVVRLYGLTFKSGQSVIRPEYFSLLSKVQRAIREFPSCHITVEGHTDGVGYQEFNQKLSEERAIAVREYLLASMGLDEGSVTAVGYGASKPIANNATAEGRAKNRRIDIVIKPHGF